MMSQMKAMLEALQHREAQAVKINELQEQLAEAMQLLIRAEGERDLLAQVMAQLDPFNEWLMEQDLSSAMLQDRPGCGYQKGSVEGQDDLTLALKFCRARPNAG